MQENSGKVMDREIRPGAEMESDAVNVAFLGGTRAWRRSENF